MLVPHVAGRIVLLRETGLIDDQHRVIRGEMFDGIVSHDVAQGIRIPPTAPQDRLLPPWSGVASRLDAHIFDQERNSNARCACHSAE